MIAFLSWWSGLALAQQCKPVDLPKEVAATVYWWDNNRAAVAPHVASVTEMARQCGLALPQGPTALVPYDGLVTLWAYGARADDEAAEDYLERIVRLRPDPHYLSARFGFDPPTLERYREVARTLAGPMGTVELRVQTLVDGRLLPPGSWELPQGDHLFQTVSQRGTRTWVGTVTGEQSLRVGRSRDPGRVAATVGGVLAVAGGTTLLLTEYARRQSDGLAGSAVPIGVVGAGLVGVGSLTITVVPRLGRPL
ncbi:MAG: hypothetical protein KTR31_17415 [Myxococcales bacterium]|nr:hypothetical protein [Myxococcales bacterium]